MVKFEILSLEDRQLVHQKSIEILAKAGIKVDSQKILKMMEKAGCEVDYDNSVIKFSAEIIEKTLEMAPSKFILGGLDPKYDLHLGEGNCYIATDGQGCFATDMETGERKKSVMADLVDAAIIAEELDYINLFWPIVSAHDVPSGSRCLHELVECWKVTSKHFQTDCFNETQAVYYRKILMEIFGTEDEIRRRKPFSLCCCPVTPLTYEGSMLEGTVALGDLDVPALVLPMPISGTTAPMSLLSTIILNNAEVLAGNAIFQTAHPNRPVIYGAAPGILDMTTSLFCVGSPEGALQNAACCEMAKMYEMPVLVCGGGADAQVPGIQAAIERMTGILPLYMTAPDIICGVGLTDTAQCLYREELVICEDIVGICKRIAEGVRSGEEHSLSDLIIQVGHGGHFLAEESTVKYLRNGEHYIPKTLSRESFESWLTSPKKDIIEFSKAKVKKILEHRKKQNFNDDLVAKLNAILAEADQKLSQN